MQHVRAVLLIKCNKNKLSNVDKLIRSNKNIFSIYLLLDVLQEKVERLMTECDSLRHSQQVNLEHFEKQSDLKVCGTV